MEYPFTACSKCHAEVSTDRENCPHCDVPLPDPPNVIKLAKENAMLKAQIAEQEAALAKENAALRAKLAGQPADAKPTDA